MSEPINFFGLAGAKYGPTIAGMVIGTAAKYGLAVTEGRRLSWRSVFADLLLLGMLGLLAIAISDAAARIIGVSVGTDYRVLIGSLAAVSSDRLVRLARDHFLKRVDAELDQLPAR
ncbi:hypothetical protein [Sphingomonas sp. Leaf257]|jgi:hypothetical protein|uniref:hypothetical protein n=1 Tax=Sphingomonas sp. Leaf257 TaxID=1736309 RepID=UPI0006F6D9DF|nr:hypothetical protein [Sphingomonas sp. Leaf257]KQO51417.1 hypothetical protein ASF14_07925 [Sphingomonas sp. Leaf257]